MLIYIRPDLSANLPDEVDHFDFLTGLQGEVYREVQGRRTLRFECNGRGFFIKVHTGIGWREIFRNLILFRRPVLGASSEWKAIRRLEEIGVPTTKLAAYGQKGWNPAWRRSFVVTDELTGTVSLEQLCLRQHGMQASAEQLKRKRQLVHEVAAMTRQLHNKGINHRDCYLCHFLVKEEGEVMTGVQLPQLYLIDLHRAQIRDRTPIRWRIKDLAGLLYSAMDAGLTRRDLLRFVREYGDQPLRTSIERDARFWRRVEIRAGRDRRRSRCRRWKKYRNRIFQNDQEFVRRNDPGWLSVSLRDRESPAFTGLLADPDSSLGLPGSRLLKEGDTTTVWRTVVDGRPVVIKRYNLKGRFHRLRRALSRSRAATSWINAHRLLFHGMTTAPPLAMVEERMGPVRGRAWFISDYVAGETALQHMTRYPSGDGAESSARALAEMFRRLAECRISHGDMKGSNIILSGEGPVLIDLDAMVGHRTQVRFLRRQQRDLRRFMKNWRNLPYVENLIRAGMSGAGLPVEDS